MPGPELRKPIDIGNGLAAASFDGLGRLLSLTTADPRCGIVELTPGPRFEWLGRHWFAWPGAAFGVSYLLWSCPSHPWRPPTSAQEGDQE